eukprot:g3936.t1
MEVGHPEQIFLSEDKTLRAVLNDRKGILSIFITSTGDCIWMGQDELFINARTCQFNVEGNKIEFKSKTDEGWIFDIKTKTCTNILNGQFEQINNNINNNNYGSAQNYERTVYIRSHENQTINATKNSTTLRPTRPRNSVRRPKSASHARTNNITNTQKVNHKRAATPINNRNGSGVGSRRKVVYRPSSSSTFRRRSKRPSSAKPRIPSRDNNKRNNNSVQRGDSYSWLKGENNNNNNSTNLGHYNIGEMPARLLTANGSILHIYGGSQNNSKYRNDNSGAKTFGSKSMHNINSNGKSVKSRRRKGPWDKMEKEEQYMKIIQLRQTATKAEGELKLMKAKVARLERQAKKKDEQVETTLGKAAAAITAALTRDAEGNNTNIGSNNGTPAIVDTSNAKLVARLQRQIYALTDRLKSKDLEIKEMKREQRSIRLNETLIELEEYKEEVTRLKEMLDYRVNLPIPIERENNLDTRTEKGVNGYVNEFKDTIRVLKVQRTHVVKENQRLSDKVLELEEALGSRAHFKMTVKKKKSSMKNKKSTHENNSRIKARKKKIKINGKINRVNYKSNRVGSNNNKANTLPWLKKIINSLQSVAAERRVPYSVAVDDLQALLVVCEETPNDFRDEYNSEKAKNDSLVSINGLLQSLQTLDHEISLTDVHNLIKELNMTSNISNDLIHYSILVDCLMDPPIDHFDPHDLNNLRATDVTNNGNYHSSKELEAIIRAQQEQLRMQNSQVSTLDATVRRLELQNKKLHLKIKERELEMPISPERKSITQNTNMIVTVNSTVKQGNNNLNDTIKTANESMSLSEERNNSKSIKNTNSGNKTTSASFNAGFSRKGRRQNKIDVDTSQKLKFSPLPPSRATENEESQMREQVQSSGSQEYLKDHQAVLDRRRALLEKRRRLELDVIKQSEDRRKERLKAIEACQKDDVRRKNIAKEMENSLRKNGHDMTSVGMPLHSDQRGVNNIKSKIDNFDGENWINENQTTNDDKPVKLTAVEGMEPARQRQKESKKLKLAEQTQDNFDSKEAKNNESVANKNITKISDELDASLKELLKLAIISGSFAQEASRKENNGRISIDHLKSSMDMVKGEENLNSAQIDAFVHKLDANRDHYVDYRELLYFVYGAKILPESVKLHSSKDEIDASSDKNTNGDEVEEDNNASNDILLSATTSNNIERQKVEQKFRESATATELKEKFVGLINSENASDFREIFEIIDVGKSGTVARDDFFKIFSDIEFDISKDVQNSLLNYFDKDGNGSINYRAFLRLCTDSADIEQNEVDSSMQAPEKVEKESSITSDNDGNDHVNHFNGNSGVENVQSMLNKIDKDGEGSVSIKELQYVDDDKSGYEDDFQQSDSDYVYDDDFEE